MIGAQEDDDPVRIEQDGLEDLKNHLKSSIVSKPSIKKNLQINVDDQSEGLGDSMLDNFLNERDN